VLSAHIADVVARAAAVRAPIDPQLLSQFP
jgi:hypothetical protein